MKISIAGSGNVAWNLGKLIKNQGMEIHQVYSRNNTKASELAYELDTESCNYISVFQKNVDVIIIALADDAILPFLENLGTTTALLLHTSGGVPMQVLQPYAQNYGVIYPLQSLRYGVTQLPEIPFLLEANSPATLRHTTSIPIPKTV
jgi:predicted dinucleotide-binding enzyme